MRIHLFLDNFKGFMVFESLSSGREEPVFAGTATRTGRSQNRDSSGEENPLHIPGLSRIS